MKTCVSAPLRCQYHPIYRECVWCGKSMQRGEQRQCYAATHCTNEPPSKPEGGK